MNLRNYAYLGDAVWELHIREKTILQTNNAKQLHKLTTTLVKTLTQKFLLDKIDKQLTDQEKEIARRARNLPIPVGRRSIQSDYRCATAFEALIGWWYLNDNSRLNDILNNLDKLCFCKKGELCNG